MKRFIAFVCLFVVSLFGAAQADFFDGPGIVRSVAKAILPPNIQVGSYTVSTQDCYRPLVQMGTGSSGLLTVSLPPASSVPNGCQVTIKNGDTTNGKVMGNFPADFGAGGNILWQQQVGQVQSVGSSWVTSSNPGLHIGSLTFQVNHASGTNTNNDCQGTGANACATIEFALSVACTQFANQGGQPTIQVAQETFTESVNAIGQCPTSSGGCAIIKGTPAAPDNTVWTAGAGGFAFFGTDYSCAIINGFKVVSSASNQTAFEVLKWSDLALENIDFGSFPGASAFHIQVFWEGHFVWEGGTYTVSAAAGAGHINIEAGIAEIQTVTPISIPNALTFTQWVNVSDRGLFYINSSFTGTGSGSGSTGSQYTLSRGGIANLNGGTLPGASIGTVSNFGCSSSVVCYGSGTWTPSLVGTSGGPVSYSIQTGSYEQIGRQVTARFTIILSALNGISGALTITGLPVTSANVSNDYGQCSILPGSITNSTGYTQVVADLAPNGTIITLLETGSGQALQGLLASKLSSSSIILGFCNYHN
jgi:hypothetical protein